MFSNSLVFLLKKRREVSPPKSHVDLPRLIDSKESGTLLLLSQQLSKRTLLQQAPCSEKHMKFVYHAQFMYTHDTNWLLDLQPMQPHVHPEKGNNERL